jgi:hypothetical protein
MANAWGQAWGVSWGAAWGGVAAVVEEEDGHSPHELRRLKQRQRAGRKLEEEALFIAHQNNMIIATVAAVAGALH